MRGTKSRGSGPRKRRPIASTNDSLSPAECLENANHSRWVYLANEGMYSLIFSHNSYCKQACTHGPTIARQLARSTWSVLGGLCWLLFGISEVALARSDPRKARVEVFSLLALLFICRYAVLEVLLSVSSECLGNKYSELFNLLLNLAQQDTEANACLGVQVIGKHSDVACVSNFSFLLT